jgi:protein-S-isoprenylcysteine O-methyltransferase Ste14
MWFLQTGVFVAIFAASLFISSGRLDWAMAWVYLALFVTNQAIVALILLPKNPELLAERARSRGPRDLDRVLTGVMTVFGPVITLIVAGLDVRFGWSSPLSPWIHAVALMIAASGALLTVWAMACNRFFYGILRIDLERGHAVATGGPYRIVRHPGYLGGSLFDLAAPLLLGSLWALVPALLTIAAIVARTALEDRALQDHLDGYGDYAHQVRSRLLPGIW